MLFSAFSEKISLPESIMDGLTHLYRLVTQHKSNQVLEVFVEVTEQLDVHTFKCPKMILCIFFIKVSKFPGLPVFSECQFIEEWQS